MRPAKLIGRRFSDGTIEIGAFMEWEDVYKACVGYVYELERQLPREKYLLYLTGSYGDIVTNLALLNSFYEKNGVEVIVIMPQRWELLAQRFNYGFVQYLLMDDSFEMRVRVSVCNIGRPFLREPGMLFPLLPTLHPWLAEFNRTDRISEFELRRGLLGVEVGANFDVPPLDERRLQHIHDFLKQSNVAKGKSICLSFLTNSNDPMPEWVQDLIYSTLQDSGFDCLINNAQSFPGKQLGSVIVPDGAKTIDIPCDCPFEVVEYCGGFIGSVNGLTMVLGGLKVLNSRLAYTDFPESCLMGEGPTGDIKGPRMERILKGDLLNRFIRVPTDEGREAVVEACKELISRF